MSERSEVVEPRVGDRLLGARGRAIGRVDAVFVDYLLVRAGWLLPVDLYVPRDGVRSEGGALHVELDRRAAYDAWHRPLKRVEHD